MKISFSTLACPSWGLDSVLAIAVREGFDGLELRFLEHDDRLWERPELSGSRLQVTRRRLTDAGLKIACVDTSCFFHHPDREKRRESAAIGRSMMELAAALGAPGIRIFGDRVQSGADFASTQAWIVEGVRELAEFGVPLGVEVWLESHGDFARGSDTMAVLHQAGSGNAGVVWDPCNAWSEFHESPEAGYAALNGSIRHVHIKDARAANQDQRTPKPVLMGTGNFPAKQFLRLLRDRQFDGFVSFEWEKRWHPEIPEPEVALPHFMRWIRSATETRP